MHIVDYLIKFESLGFETCMLFVFQAALICSLVNGKIFMEWVSPAVLKAYQWQVIVEFVLVLLIGRLQLSISSVLG